MRLKYIHACMYHNLQSSPPGYQHPPLTASSCLLGDALRQYGNQPWAVRHYLSPYEPPLYLGRSARPHR